MRRNLALTPLPGVNPEIGRWLWALEDVRRTVKNLVAGLPQAVLDYQPPHANSVGTLLYHIAVIEADWLYEEVLGARWDLCDMSLFPSPAREENGVLSPVVGVPLDEHLQRLDAMRAVLLSHFQGMTAEEWRRPRELEHYDVTPEWVIYHLIEHEAHHRGQIADLLRVLRASGEFPGAE
jgi:uncharacterized damage-inducible protein DinB